MHFTFTREAVMPNLIEMKDFKRKPFEIKNKTETVAEIFLYAAIGESFWEDSVSAKDFKEELKKLPANIKEIQLRVNSPGGSVFDGMSIYELIKSEKNKGRKVVAYVDGLAASIASVIIMAADEIIVGDGSMVMIHKPLTGVYGNSAEMERMINILDQIENQMVSIYAKKTGLSRAEISNLLAEETWMTSDEALSKGFVDNRFEACDTLHIAASMIAASPYLKKPVMNQTTNAVMKEKLADFTAKAKEYAEKKKIK